MKLEFSAYKEDGYYKIVAELDPSEENYLFSYRYKYEGSENGFELLNLSLKRENFIELLLFAVTNPSLLLFADFLIDISFEENDNEIDYNDYTYIEADDDPTILVRVLKDGN